MLYNGAFYKPLHRKETKENRGYDYKGNIMRNTMSKAMLGTNKTVYDFVMQLENVVDSLVDSVKSIHVFTSIARDKNDRSLN